MKEVHKSKATVYKKRIAGMLHKAGSVVRKKKTL